MRRLAWTFAARIGDKYQIRLTQSKGYRRTYGNIYESLDGVWSVFKGHVLVISVRLNAICLVISNYFGLQFYDKGIL